MERSFDSGSHAMRGRIGALVTNSRYPGDTVTAKARATFINNFVIQARAEALERGEALSDDEAERRGEFLRRAHYARLALKSARARARIHRDDEAAA